MLKALYSLDGHSTTKEVRQKMRAELEGCLKPFDFEIVGSKQERWWNNVCWTRNALVNEGLFRNDSPRGVWELSQQGKDYVEQHFGPDGQD